MITDLDDLRAHLQTALQIEHTTIPPYLCALWSIEPGSNEAAAEAIRDVVMEEMLHMTLVANVLNAVGGTPSLYRPDFLPATWPAFLPHSDDAFAIDLAPLSPTTLRTFLAIEQPEAAHAPPQDDHYRTLAQFYDAIQEALERLAGERDIFTGDRSRQVTPALYYGGGGAVVEVHNLETARAALTQVVDEGEGVKHTIFESDDPHFDEPRELAHYFRFSELAEGRRYRRSDTPASGPTGEPVFVDYTRVRPMHPNPRAEDHPPGSELRELTDACSRTSTALLGQLEAALTGAPRTLIEAVVTMKRLQQQAVALLQVPWGDGVHTAGPAFQWRPGQRGSEPV
jgi:hypothetical protein